METGNLVNHQIKVEITNEGGVIILTLPDHQKIVWPVRDQGLSQTEMYLLLSPTKELPTKEELAKQVLKEILQGGQ